MIKDVLLDTLTLALTAAAPELNLPHGDVQDVLDGLRFERPRNPEHGDYAVNVSSLARHAKMPPPKIAETVSRHLPASLEGIEATVVGGYINFRVQAPPQRQALLALLKTQTPGASQALAGQAILLEYVSANPTGPLHIGHGRWAALGDSLVRIFRHCGALVTPEFYINDAGVQMRNIAASVFIRSREVLVEQGALESSVMQLAYEPPYPGDYVTELARQLLESDTGLKAELTGHWQKLCQAHLSATSDTLTVVDVPTEAVTRLIPPVKERMLAEQRVLLERMHVTFENWFSEKELIHDRGLVEETLARLKNEGFAYESEGALWFRSTDFGDEKDRVLVKSDGSYTYLSADIAYHDQKFNREDDNGQPQYNLIMNIWGADHHGYIARMRGAIQALGHNPGQFEVVLGQLVKLIVDGERARMGKRRKMVTLEDLIDEVGVDATRYWMVSRSADVTLDFDVDLAMSASNENPVFYVQYAHARCASILRNAVEPSPNVDIGTMSQPVIAEDKLRQLEQQPTEALLEPLFSALENDTQREAVKQLIFLLDNFEDMVKDAARLRAPHFLTQYSQDVARHFHSFYNVCRVLTDNPDVTLARLGLILAVQKVLAQALDLLGVSAPEKM